VNGGGDGSGVLQRGALSFWDVLPRLEGDRLWVDVMTPHQTHYYQPKAGGARANDKNTAGSSSPHDSGQPNPIHFLTVPPGSRFVFHVGCDPDRLPATLKEGNRWRERLGEAFEHAFEWLGFGAKTAVGYGAMARDLKAEQDAAALARQRREADERKARLATMTENMRRIEAFKEEFAARAGQLRGGGKDKPNTGYHGKARRLASDALEGAGWTAEERRVAAEAIEAWLPVVVHVDMKDERKKLKLASLRGSA
jgi:CRISPR-associated protein Cmr6